MLVMIKWFLQAMMCTDQICYRVRQNCLIFSHSCGGLDLVMEMILELAKGGQRPILVYMNFRPSILLEFFVSTILSRKLELINVCF